MGSRDHSVECEKCGLMRGGLNDLKCDCDPESGTVIPAWHGTFAQADSARALLDALIYPNRDFDYAWDQASLHWGRFGEVPAKIALLEVAVLELCEILGRSYVSAQADKDRIQVIKASVS
jgi:hypothetical protein